MNLLLFLWKQENIENYCAICWHMPQKKHVGLVFVNKRFYAVAETAAGFPFFSCHFLFWQKFQFSFYNIKSFENILDIKNRNSWLYNLIIVKFFFNKKVWFKGYNFSERGNAVQFTGHDIFLFIPTFQIS